jgi:hypothetical protein
MDMMEAKLFSKAWIYKNIFNMSEDDAKAVKEEVVEDVIQNYRFASIEEEGNDPAKPFKKIGIGKVKGGGDSMGGGGGGVSGMDDEDMTDLGGEEGGPEGGPEGGEGGLGGGGPEGLKEVEGNPNEPVVGEVKLERDQSGEHKASDHPFGEDPLGDQELHAKPKKRSEGKKKSAITHNFAGGTPLAMKEGQRKSPKPDQALMSSLSKFNSATRSDIKKELLAEAQTTGSKKSMLDESNILE